MKAWNVLDSIHGWFFAPKDSRVVGLYRILIGATLLASVLLMAPYVRELFTSEGFVAGPAVATATQYAHRFSIFFWYDAPWFIYSAYAVLVAAAACLMLGIRSQIACAVAYLLFLCFDARFPLFGYGGTQFLIISLFFLMFVNSDAAYALMPIKKSEFVSSWPIRFIQIQICIVYLFTAIAKLQHPGWYAGTQLLYILNSYNALFNFSWLSRVPLLVAAGTYGTVFAELSFSFLVWNPKLRIWCVLVMTMFHLGILLTMNVTLFSEIFISTLVLFLTGDEVEWLLRLPGRIRRLFRSRLWRYTGNA